MSCYNGIIDFAYLLFLCHKRCFLSLFFLLLVFIVNHVNWQNIVSLFILSVLLKVCLLFPLYNLMCGVLFLLIHCLGFNIISTLWIIILQLYRFIYQRVKVMCVLHSSLFIIWLSPNIIPSFVYSGLTMVGSIYLIIFLHILMSLVLFTRPHVRELLSKMEWLNIKTNIFLKLLVQLY